MNYISVSELSEYLKIPKVTTYLYTRKGVFPSERIAGKIVINKAALPEIEETLSAHRRFRGVSSK